METVAALEGVDDDLVVALGLPSPFLRRPRGAGFSRRHLITKP